MVLTIGEVFILSILTTLVMILVFWEDRHE